MAWIKGVGFAALLVLTPALAVNTFNAEGVVNNVKTKEKKLTITHGPVDGLMEGMTMDFAVLDPLMLDAVKVGNPIKFTLTKDNSGNLVITNLEPLATSTPRK